jgi:hypothetical protein
MNQKVKTIVLLGVFALFIVGAVLAYNLLGEKVAPPENLGEMKSEGEVTQASEEDINKIKAPDFTVWDREGNEV